MAKKVQARGFSVVEVLVIVVVIATVGLSGWYIWHKDKRSTSIVESNGMSTQTNKQNGKVADPSDGGKYLVIKEWQTRVALSQDLQDKVSYVIGDADDPDSGLPLQAAKIYVTSDSLTTNDCGLTNTSLGASVDSGAQYIRSSNAKPFNASRYKWTFKEDILTDGTYSYHLNYVTPDCIGTGSNSTKIEELQADLVKLAKYN